VALEADGVRVRGLAALSPLGLPVVSSLQPGLRFWDGI
jgi:hypothetical protein